MRPSSNRGAPANCAPAKVASAGGAPAKAGGASARIASTRGASALSNVLLVVGLLLIAAAIAIAGFLIFKYVDAQNRNAQISSIAGLDVMEEAAGEGGLQLEDLYFDWDALRATNPDIAGWIIIPGTRINYPIVQGPNNTYYLYHLFDSSSSDVGSVFVDYEGSNTLTGRNNLVYGHHVFDGSMFTDLTNFKEQEYFDAHTVVFLCTPQMNYELKPFATLKMHENAPLRRFEFVSDEELLGYLDEMLGYALIRTPEPAAADIVKGNIYSFTTCDNLDFSQRIVLACSPVRSIAPPNAPTKNTPELPSAEPEQSEQPEQPEQPEQSEEAEG